MLSQLYFEQGKYEAHEVAAAFDRYGVVVVKHAVEAGRIEALASALKRLFAARLASLGIVPRDPDNLDRLYEQLAADDAKHVGEIFVLVRQLVEHADLILSAQILALVKTLIPDSILQVIPEACGIRIDPGGDETRTFGWHHDYSFLAMSLNGITGWAPLAPLTSEMGWLRVVPGSQKTITPVIFHESFAAKANFKGHRAYELRVDENELEAQSVEYSRRCTGRHCLHPLMLAAPQREERVEPRTMDGVAAIWRCARSGSRRSWMAGDSRRGGATAIQRTSSGSRRSASFR